MNPEAAAVAIVTYIWVAALWNGASRWGPMPSLCCANPWAIPKPTLQDLARKV